MSDLTGQFIERYQIIELLGQGGMAYVYKAFDTRLERMVAIKVIRQDAFAPKEMQDLTKRFEREAKSLAKLDHPNIVKIFDYGEHGGSPYLVMQYVGGGSLRECLKEQGELWHWRKSARLLIPIAWALDYAHQQNIIHRDVKTPNILLTTQDIPMLSDFGIAKIVAPGVVATLTGTGVGIGTPEYMAPEQAMGKVFPQSDIYSLGIVFFELITGQLPYSADTPMAVILKHLNEPLPSPRGLNPSLPEAVEKILLKALAKQPEERYTTAAEMAEALENLMQLPDEVFPPTVLSASIPQSGVPGEMETVPALPAEPETVTGVPAVAAPAGFAPPAQSEVKPPVETMAHPLVLSAPTQPEPPEPALKTPPERSKPRPRIGGVIPILIVMLALVGFFWVISENGWNIFQQTAERFSPTLIPTRALPSAVVFEQSEPIKVAFLLPLSGSSSSFGISARDGMSLALEEWNSKGGVLGRRIEPIIEDTQCKADLATQAAERVIDQNKVHYIIGEVCSMASIPVSQIAEEKGVVMVSPTSTNPTVTLNADGSTKQYVFRACFVDPFQAVIMAKFAMDQGFKSAFILFNKNDDYSRGLGLTFEQAWMQARGRVLGVEPYTSETTDFTPILTKAVYSKADFLYLPDYYYRINLIAQQAKHQGVASVLIGSDGWDSPELDLQMTNGGYFSNHYSAEDPRPIVQEWVKKYQERYGKAPDAIATLTYDSIHILLNAIKRAGGDDPAKVKDTLASEGFEAVTGWTKFDGHHNPIKPAVVMQIKDGRIVFITSIQP
ncbi:MAG: penicillin-binding protein activator [Anaerolineales bacterium]